MAAYVCDIDPTSPTDSLVGALSAFRKGDPKLHWRDLPDPQRLRVRRTLAAVESLHVVVAVTPANEIRDRRARGLVLRQMIRTLTIDYGVARLILEAQDPASAKKDLAVLLGERRHLEYLGLDPRMEHARGSEVPRLWVPDQVLGAFGARHLGRPEYWEALTGSGPVLIENIRLDPAVLQAGTTRTPGPIHDRYSGVYFHSTSVAGLQVYDRHARPGKRSTRLIRHARNGCDPADRRGVGSSPRAGAGIDVGRRRRTRLPEGELPGHRAE